MRKWNAILSAVILLLFLVHSIAGMFQLAGILSGGKQWLTIMTWGMTILIAVHAVLGCILTAETLRSIKKSGASYYKENRLFWLRRISGFAIMLLIGAHIAAFQVKETAGAVRLPFFGGLQLTLQLLLVASVAVHVLTNIKPLMLSLGTVKARHIFTDILVILSVLLAAAGVGFIIYFIRFNVL